jgi:hypothetical protein
VTQGAEYSTLQAILLEMHDLLVKHDEGQQEATAQAVQAVKSLDRLAIASSLNSPEFWGGMGSIIDLNLTEMPWTAEFRRDVVDDNRLTMLELDLVNEMERLGIAKPEVISRRVLIQFSARHKGVLPTE